MKRLLHLGCACLLLVASSGARARGSDAEQPIDIRARSVEANEKTGVSIYQGDVVMTQGSLRIEADRLEVTLRAGQVQQARGWGNPVRVRTRTEAGEELRARAQRLEYRARPRELDLYDNVELRRDGDLLTGSSVQYSLEQDSFVAKGGPKEQVHAVIQPAPPERAR